jgi:hypothetical protein
VYDVLQNHLEDVEGPGHVAKLPDPLLDRKHGTAELLNDYDSIIEMIQTSGLPIEQIQALDSERMVLHEMIIEEVKRLGYTIRTREEAVWKTRQIIS